MLITTGTTTLLYLQYLVILYFTIMIEQVLSPLPTVSEVGILDYLSKISSFDKSFGQYANKRVDLFGSRSKHATIDKKKTEESSKLQIRAISETELIRPSTHSCKEWI